MSLEKFALKSSFLFLFPIPNFPQLFGKILCILGWPTNVKKFWLLLYLKISCFSLRYRDVLPTRGQNWRNSYLNFWISINELNSSLVSAFYSKVDTCNINLSAFISREMLSEERSGALETMWFHESNIIKTTVEQFL